MEIDDIDDGAEDCQQKSDFIGYDKIEESSGKWILSDSDLKKFKQTKWTVTEKIHGANFCFVVEPDNTTINAGNRRQLLSDTDNFFGHRELVERLKPIILEASRLVREMQRDATRVYLYGELFGGIYPHPDVAANARVQPVQTGIYYSPNIEFAAFDIAYETQTVTRRQFLDFGDAVTIFERSKLFHAAPIFIGKYEQAIDYSPAFESTVSRKLGFPRIPDIQNKAEGVVIRPMKEILVNSKKGLVRAVIKNKIPEFREDKRFHGAQKWESSPSTGSNTTESVENSLFYEAVALITEQRLENAISKFGRPTKAERDRLRDLFALYFKDIMDQLKEDNEATWTQFTTESSNRAPGLERRIKEEASILFKSYFDLK